MAALPLSIKEKALWKRLVQQYEANDLIEMIDNWMDGKHGRYNPADFIIFYSVSDTCRPKDYEWD